MVYDIYAELHEEFERRAYVWKIGAVHRVPTADEIKLAVDNAVKNLYAEPDGAAVFRGRLVVQKQGDHFDIYLHMGETK